MARPANPYEVKRFTAIIANSSEAGSTGLPRSGVWRLRIPVAEFEDFLEAVDDLGEVSSKSRDSQDVTEEFYDVEARIRNKRVQEDGLIKILEERVGKLEEVLAVERELSRVREEIERMEGRLRLLKDLISLTTVTLRVHEIKDYVPEHAPEFGTRIGRSWKGSLQSLGDFGASCVVWLVGAGPWIVVLGLPPVGIVFVADRRARKRRAARNRSE